MSVTIPQSLLKLMSIVSMMAPNHLILCHPLLLLASMFPSIRVFSNDLALCAFPVKGLRDSEATCQGQGSDSRAVSPTFLAQARAFCFLWWVWYGVLVR